MPSPNPSSRGRDLASRLQAGIDEFQRAPSPGARDLPVVSGITPKCVFREPLENVRALATSLLVGSGKVFLLGGDVVYEAVSGANRRLVPLARSGAIETAASAVIANLMICEHAEPGRDSVQFVPPQSFVSLLLNSNPTRAALPMIQTYASRPIFDENFCLLSPGWHPEPGIMVHGPEVEPVFHPSPEPGEKAIDRLPPRLRALLAGFCFRGPADVVAAVATLLTGLLANHFVTAGKALILIDGNQPGLGKTLLARILGILMDGADPRLIHYAPDDDELAKRICATIRGNDQSVVIIDNAKVRAGGVISSPVLEANSMAPQLSLRILGQSANFTRPNDLTWVVTMNDTKTSPDLVSRGMPIRLSFAGDPRLREFTGVDPIAYATENRVELLGELAGMVIKWNHSGRPPGSVRHRCERWARVIGGILGVAGLPEFLGNLEEAAASFNQGLDELAALAEAAAAAEGGQAILIPEAITDPPDDRPRKKKAVHGLLAGEWEPLFRRANLQGPALEAAKSHQAKATLIGNFLTVNVNREVSVQVQGHPGRARLAAFDAGRRQTRYAFEIVWDGEPPPPRAGAGGERSHQHQGSARMEPGDSRTAPTPD